jgi:peptidoglycan/xylan/chitin deacetylase (PgdA/CDA1 family)
MNLRNRVRALCIQISVLARLDELALFLRARRGRYGVVVGVHETPMSLEGRFRKQLEWAARHFSIVDLEGFVTLWEGPDSRPNGKPPLLFTFDDGRESNYLIAAPLLEQFGTRGVFFVVPEFVAAPQEKALTYYRARVNPDSKPGDEVWEDWKPMTAAQIGDLAARGHVVGSHTWSHSRLDGLPPEALEREIGDSARKIRSWTGKDVDAFAWTFAWDAVDRNAWKVIRRYHRYCFAPCAGDIQGGRDIPTLIWRREIEVDYSQQEFRFQYSGLGDPVWARRRERLRQRLGVPA